MAAVEVETIDIDAVKASVHKDFDDLLTLIPHYYYFPKVVDESRWESKYSKNKKTDKTVIREAKKQKKAQKLDPDPANYQSIPQMLLARIGQDAPLKPLSRPSQPEEDDNDAEDSPNDEEIDSDHDEMNGGDDSDDDDDGEDSPKPKNSQQTNMEVDDDEMVPFMPSDDREAARKKLLEKINELRRKRKAPELDDNFKSGPKDTSAPVSKRRKTKESDSKEKPKPPKNNKNPKGTSDNKGGDADAMDVDTNGNNSGSNNNKKKQSAAQDVDESGIQFGTFDFSTGKPLPTYLAQQRKRPSNKVLLKKAEEDKQKLEALGAAEAESIKESKAWDAVMKRAAGEKVKDNITLLKKSVKREEVKKKKSTQMWKERGDAVKKSQDERIKKRNENIQNALQKKKDKRMGIKPKKTGRAGFEGKKPKF